MHLFFRPLDYFKGSVHSITYVYIVCQWAYLPKNITFRYIKLYGYICNDHNNTTIRIKYLKRNREKEYMKNMNNYEQYVKYQN